MEEKNVEKSLKKAMAIEEDFNKFVATNETKDMIRRFCPPYEEIQVSTLLWYLNSTGTKVNDQQLRSILSFVDEHVDNSHQLYDLVYLIKTLKEA